MNLSIIEATDFQTGSLITRVTNDVTQIQNFVSMALRMFVRALSLFVLGIIFTITINPIFGVVIAIALPIEVLILILFMKKVFPHFGRIQEELDEVNVVVHENVGGSRVVKAFSKEDYERARFVGANDKYTSTLLTISKYSAVLMPLLTLIVYIAQVAIYSIGGSRIVNFYNGLQTDLDISIDKLTEPMRVTAKARYRMKDVPATIEPCEDGLVHVIFDEPQRAITPGQAVVFYDGQYVVGGGIIER